MVSVGAPHVSVLLGAGFSVDADLPTSVNLTQSLKDALTADGESSRAERSGARTEALLPALHLLNGGIRFQEGVMNRDPEGPVNIEQVAQAALELAGRMENPVTPFAAGWHHRLVELESTYPKLLDELVDFVYEHLPKWLAYKEIGDLEYMACLSELQQQRGNLDIFSLNYDLCLEAALQEIASQPFTNGFTSTGGWEPAEFLNESSIRLFKLHGSLDWVDDEAYGLCSLEFPKHQYAEDLDPDRRPLLIFGTRNKVTGTQPFVTLMYHFSESLFNTGVLVIIGYSFGDQYVNDMIAQAVRSSPSLRILIVNPTQRIADIHLRRLIEENPRVQWICSGAKTALESGQVREQTSTLLDATSQAPPF